MKVLGAAVGAVFASTRFSLVRISIRDLVADGKSLVRKSKFDPHFCAPKVQLKWYGFKGVPAHSSYCSGDLIPEYSRGSPNLQNLILKEACKGNLCLWAVTQPDAERLTKSWKGQKSQQVERLKGQGYAQLEYSRNCLKYVQSNSVPSRLLPKSHLLNLGRGPKSNRTSRLLPGSF